MRGPQRIRVAEARGGPALQQGALRLDLAVLDAAVDAILLMDEQGRIVGVNTAAERTFGYAREEAVGRDLADLIIPPELRDAHRRGLAAYRERGVGSILGRRVEMSAQDREGRRFPVELTVVEVPPAGSLFAGFVRDLTEVQRDQRAARHLAALVQSSDDAILSKDGRGIITSWNPGAERLYGYTADEAVGQPVSLIVPAERAGEEGHILEQAMRGEDLRGYETERRRKDGSLVGVSLVVSPIRGPGGGVVGVSVIARDITDRKLVDSERLALLERAEVSRRRLAFLAEASALLDRSLDAQRTLRDLASLCVPRLADVCVIDQRAEHGDITGVVAAAAGDAATGATLERVRGRNPLDPQGPHPVAQVLRSGRPLLLAQMTDQTLADIAESGEHLNFMQTLGYRSAVVAPLRARGRTLGALSVLRVEGSHPYDDEDLKLVVGLAGRAAMALDNAQLYEQTRRIAVTLQQSLLPAELPAIPGFELAAHYRPAGVANEVGGDFYDVFALDDRSWALVIGDVCGKGPEAAALTALTRYTIRAVATPEASPERVLTALNRAILREDVDQRFCTAVYARVEVGGGRPRVTLASAGHPSPILCARHEIRRAVGNGRLLGVTEQMRLSEASLTLDEGDALVLYTDGLTEAGAPERVFSEDDLTGLLSRSRGQDAGRLIETLEQAAVSAAGGVPRDDIAIVALKFVGDAARGGAR